MTRLTGVFLVALLVVSALALAFLYIHYHTGSSNSGSEFYFGVTFGGQTVQEADTLIDKMHGFSNLFVIDSLSISNNLTALNQVCKYAQAANMHFIVYFLSFYQSPQLQEWVNTAKHTWGNNFLGVYLRDEPAGRQLDTAQPISNAANQTEAAAKFVANVSQSYSMVYLKNNAVPIFTSDYALYLYDYQAGYDTVFAELGSNSSTTEQIALCRGAANESDRNWGAIVTWTYTQPPYLASGPQIYRDMVTAYNAGAKYILVFDYPQYPPTNPYGVLTEDQFAYMKQFWNYTQSTSRKADEVTAQVAYVLPNAYGAGLRSFNDTIWGLWPANTTSIQTYQNVISMVETYGLKLNILYNGYGADFKQYTKVIYWNETTTQPQENLPAPFAG